MALTAPKTELWIDGAWVDVTDRVRQQPGISITRGRRDEASTAYPANCSLAINNADGQFSPRNPTSTYYGKIGRNTPLRVYLPIAADAFGGSSSNGWGTADLGGAWSTSGGSASDYAEGSGVGTHTQTSVNVSRATFLAGVSRADCTVTATTKAGVIATGANIQMAVVARRADASNFYLATVRFDTDSTWTLVLAKRVAGTTTTLSSTADTYTYSTSTQVGVELTLIGRWLHARAWDVATPANTITLTSEDSDLTAGGTTGCRSLLATGNTNTNPALAYDNFRTDDIRFVGEVTGWPPMRDTSGNDIWVPITAAGIARRLSQGASPARSALYRGITLGTVATAPASALLGYWPMEDTSGATQAAAGIDGIRPSTMYGTITFAAGAGPAGSDSLPDINRAGARLAFRPAPSSFNTGEGWSVLFWFVGNGTGSMVPLTVYTNGDYPVWRLTISDTAVTLTVRDVADTAAATVNVSTNALDSQPHLIAICPSRTSDVAVTITLHVDEDNDDVVLGTSTLDTPASAQMPGPVAPVDINEARGGHLSVYSVVAGTDTITDYLEIGGAWVGETAGERIQRLCSEEGLTFVPVGDVTDTAQMGTQGISSPLQLMQDCADVDHGILLEPRQLFGLSYVTRTGLYNRTATCELDYDAGHLAPPFEPEDDDALVRNDITVSRDSGSSYRTTLTSGALSVNAPPDGVGTYDEQVSLDAYLDDQLPDLAGWRLHLGTWDEARFPTIAVALHSSPFQASASLLASVHRLDVGHLLTVDNPPTGLPPDTIEQIVQGYAEMLGQFTHDVAFTCRPNGPYRVGVLDSDTLGKLDTDGSALHTAVNSSATSWKVATTSTAPRWTTDAGEYNFDLAVAGERVTATACSNSTYTFVGAGTAATNANAAGTSTLSPALHASVASGDLLLVLASIRNSGTGIPDTPTGYTRLPAFPTSSNVQLFGKIAGSSESAPTVSFTGGVANATVVAQTAAFRSTLYDVDNLAVAYSAVLNPSAQDITYPGLPVYDANCIILWLGWKQDDWTSVATLADATAEIGEPDETGGDDAGIVWNYTIQTTATHVATGAFTVTGGAAAISRGAVIAIRSDVQTMTVTRSVNGVQKAQTVGTAISLWQPLKLAL